MKRTLAKWEEATYAGLRFVSGFMFTWHGTQKLFGGFGKSPIELAAKPQLWIGGVIELVCGVAIATGLATRWAAIVASGTMAVAFFQYHVGRNPSAADLLPIANKGELAALYAFVFLFVATRGPGRVSLDRVFKIDD